MQYQVILDFWFKELKPAMWWRKDPELDSMIQQRFGDVHAAAGRGELYEWRAEPLGRLAEIIVLDQFSRTIYRDQAQAFAWDGMALVLAQEAIRLNAHAALTLEQKSFLYMPFMHSESLLIHHIAVRLFGEPGLEDGLDFELQHQRIIERFGRYPHRNRALGRSSSAAELEFLKEPGSSF